MANFARGNEVILKTGGAVMTVLFVDGAFVRCSWVDQRGVVSAHFHETLMQPSPPSTENSCTE